MTIHQNPPAAPPLRPERAAADKAALADAMRLSAAEPTRAPRVRLGAALEPWRRRPALASAGAVATLAIVAVVVVALTTAPGGGDHPSAISSGTHPKWTLMSDVSSSWRTLPGAQYQPQFGLPGLGFSCPTTTTCYAVNFKNPGPSGTSEVVVTTDAGATWTQSALPVTLSSPGPAALSCPDSSTCGLLGTDASGSPIFLETTDGGQTWSQGTGPTGLGASFGTRLVCFSASSCVGVTGGGGPVTATQPEISSDELSPFAFATTDGGATWTTSSLPGGFTPTDLQCPSTTDCVASGGGAPFSSGGSSLFAYTTDGGSTWAMSSASVGDTVFGGLRKVSCSGNSCLANAVGPGSTSPTMLASSDAGATWTAETPTGLPTGFVMGLSCVGSGDCWATGVTTGSLPASAVVLSSPGYAAYTADNGATWQAATLPSGVGAVLTVSCPSATTCFALAVAQDSANPGAASGFVLLEYGGSTTTDTTAS